MTNSTTASNKFQLLIQTNSPGELASWVTPIVKAASQKDPDVEITLFLTPCQYASGKEEEIAQNLPNIKRVFSPRKTIKHLFSFPIKTPFKKGAVLFLGGDPLYAAILGFKYNLPAYGYTEHKKSLGLGYKQTFFKHNIGDLMADSIQIDPSLNKDIDLLFFTGSRPQHFEAFFPIICQTAQQLKQSHPHLKTVINISPFISETFIKKTKRITDTSLLDIRQEKGQTLLQQSKNLITLTGTATAEAAYIGTPMIACAPLNNPKLIIFDGLLGLIGKLPIIGTLLKKLALVIILKKKTFYALPNRLAKKEIVKELVAVITPELLITTFEEELLNDAKRQQQIDALQQLKPTQSPVNAIISTLFKS